MHTDTVYKSLGCAVYSDDIGNTTNSQPLPPECAKSNAAMAYKYMLICEELCMHFQHLGTRGIYLQFFNGSGKTK
jgi:hypothetical protein